MKVSAAVVELTSFRMERKPKNMLHVFIETDERNAELEIAVNHRSKWSGG